MRLNPQDAADTASFANPDGVNSRVQGRWAKVGNETKFGMDACAQSLMFFPVTEDGRKVLVEFIHNLW